MRILNLYAGIGGNRRLWGDEHEVVAVELDPKIAAAYAMLYPSDTVVVADAHEYLLNHFAEFDFIWSSPPCQSHSKLRFHVGVQGKGFAPKFPDMSLYEEIIFLRHHFAGAWAVENVDPYYGAIMKPTAKLNRHLYWSNFPLPRVKAFRDDIRSAQIPQLQLVHDFNLEGISLPDKRQALRNCVPAQDGLAILRAAENWMVTHAAQA